MISIDIPGFGKLDLEYLVLDYNGTLSCDGVTIPGVTTALNALSESIQVHVLTADTFGRAGEQLKDLPCKLVILPGDNQDTAKRDYVAGLGSDRVAAIGNGMNDRLMLETAALGIAVVLNEGAAAKTLISADVVCSTIQSAFELLTHPLRLTATLRS